MKIIESKKFRKAYEKLPFEIKKIVVVSLLEIKDAKDKEEIFQLKPVRKKNYYSINIGEAYRIGVKITDNTVVMLTVGERAAIYTTFS